MGSDPLSELAVEDAAVLSPSLAAQTAWLSGRLRDVFIVVLGVSILLELWALALIRTHTLGSFFFSLAMMGASFAALGGHLGTRLAVKLVPAMAQNAPLAIVEGSLGLLDMVRANRTGHPWGRYVGLVLLLGAVAHWFWLQPNVREEVASRLLAERQRQDALRAARRRRPPRGTAERREFNYRQAYERERASTLAHAVPAHSVHASHKPSGRKPKVAKDQKKGKKKAGGAKEWDASFMA